MTSSFQASFVTSLHHTARSEMLIRLKTNFRSRCKEGHCMHRRSLLCIHPSLCLLCLTCGCEKPTNKFQLMCRTRYCRVPSPVLRNLSGLSVYLSIFGHFVTLVVYQSRNEPLQAFLETLVLEDRHGEQFQVRSLQLRHHLDEHTRLQRHQIDGFW